MRSFLLALAAMVGTVAVSGSVQAAPVALQPPILIAAAPDTYGAAPGAAVAEPVQYYRGRRYYRRGYYRRYRRY